MYQVKKIKRKKQNKKAIIVILVLLLISIAMLILGFQINKKGYEFYDINNNYGTSPNCKIKNETLICNVNGYDVPVKQFSKIE